MQRDGTGHGHARREAVAAIGHAHTAAVLEQNLR
jgi:hypothetical protein